MAEQPWLLRKSSTAAQEFGLVMTPLDGKVFAIQRKVRAQREKRKQTKDAQQILSEDLAAKQARDDRKARAAKGAGKAASKAKAKAKARAGAEDIGGDTLKETEEVMIDNGEGISLARPKLFLDCLMLSIRSAVLAARKKYGLPHNVEMAELVAEGEPVKYSEMEVALVREHVRMGLVFALQGNNMLSSKQHKRWSSMRPALQTHLVRSYQEARGD